MLAIACILATYLLSQLSLVCSIFVLILVSRSLSVRIAIDNIRRSVPVRAYALQVVGTSLESTQSTLNRAAWLIDSRASDHIACELHYFTDWKSLQRPIPIILGNHSSVQATCIGSIT